MEVIILGSGCGVPSKSRGSPSILISVEKDNLLFDTGPGSLRRLAEAGFTYQDIDYLLYTHFHVDHIADLAPFLFASKYPLNIRERELHIVGARGFKEHYQKLFSLYGEQIQSLNYEIKITEVNPGDKILSKTDGRWEITAAKMVHVRESIGYRIKDRRGRVVVYSGDTEYCNDIIELSYNADLLILECSFPEKTPGHIYPGVAGKIAREAGVKHLVINHLYPICDSYDILSPIRAEFNGKITISEDLLKIEC